MVLLSRDSCPTDSRRALISNRGGSLVRVLTRRSSALSVSPAVFGLAAQPQLKLRSVKMVNRDYGRLSSSLAIAERESDFGRMSSSVEIEECENGSPSLESWGVKERTH
jgi:hypothetical protein